MARILGLDLGSHSVKGLLLQAGKTTAVSGWVEERRGEGAAADTLRAALIALKAQLPAALDQVIVSLPGLGPMTHAFSLPFTEPRRVEATLPFEVESQLPFDLAEAVFDYQPTVRAGSGTDVVVGVVRRDELVPLLALLAELGLDPRIVTHPAIVYQNVLAGAPAGSEVPAAHAAAVVDVGHLRTNVAVGSLGRGLLFARTFAGGGAELTRALAAEFQVPLDEAERWKERDATLLGNGGPDHLRARAALLRGLQPLLRELRSTLKAATARGRLPIGRVLLCGGTSALPGLADQWSSELGLPVSLLSLLENAAVPEAAGPRAAQAWALATRGASGRTARLNFRRGELAFKGDFGFLRARAGQLGAFAAVLFALFVGFGIVRGVMLGHREAAVDTQLCEVTRRILGSCEKNYDRALNLLRGRESPTAAVPRLSAVALLAEVSQRIPPELPVTLNQVLVDLDRLTVRGETDGSKSIDKISAALKSFRCFKEVKEGKVERSKDGQHVSFQLDVLVDCGDGQPAAG